MSSDSPDIPIPLPLLSSESPTRKSSSTHTNKDHDNDNNNSLSPLHPFPNPPTPTLSAFSVPAASGSGLRSTTTLPPPKWTNSIPTSSILQNPTVNPYSFNSSSSSSTISNRGSGHSNSYNSSIGTYTSPRLSYNSTSSTGVNVNSGTSAFYKRDYAQGGLNSSNSSPGNNLSPKDIGFGYILDREREREKERRQEREQEREKKEEQQRQQQQQQQQQQERARARRDSFARPSISSSSGSAFQGSGSTSHFADHQNQKPYGNRDLERRASTANSLDFSPNPNPNPNRKASSASSIGVGVGVGAGGITGTVFPPPVARAGAPDPGSGSTSGSGAGSGSGANGSKRRKREESEKPSEKDLDDRPLAVTCAPCRARKIKCDSKKPTCENCSKNPSECYYPVKLKPGLRPGAGMDVMRRVELLEDRMHAYEVRLADQETRLVQMTQNQFAPPLPINTNNQPFIQTPTSAMPLPSAMDFAHDMVNPQDMANPHSFGASGHTASPSGLSTTSFRDPQVLPPDDIVRDLIALFFTHIHPWAPILSPTLPNYAPPWNIVVHAIVVVTLRLSTDHRLASSKQAYRQAAKQHILGHAIESTSIGSVQALALLALDLIGSEQGPSSWGILALLTRSAVHLGLGKEEESASLFMTGRAPTPSLSRTSIIPPPTSWHEDELRRRLFWLIFCLDRYACVSTGWDFALPDFDIKRRLPASDELWAKHEWTQTPAFKPVLHREFKPDPSVLSPMAYLVEALDLLGRAHTLQVQTIEAGDMRAIEVRKDMTMTLTSAGKRWMAELPVRDRRDSMSLMIQAIHHATLLKLNAYYAFPALSNGEPQEPYTSTCLSSIQAIVELVNTAREVGFQTSSSPLFIWSSWVGARVIFVHAFLSGRLQPDEDFDVIVSALKEQSQWWTLANQYRKLLERAKRKWLSASQDANPNLPEAIHVLLDLRRTAYSAVGANSDATPFVSPPDVNLSHLPAWAVQPLLGDLHDWFDLPAGLFQADV